VQIVEREKQTIEETEMRAEILEKYTHLQADNSKLEGEARDATAAVGRSKELLDEKNSEAQTLKDELSRCVCDTGDMCTVCLAYAISCVCRVFVERMCFHALKPCAWRTPWLK
jgi:hypothetical protein